MKPNPSVTYLKYIRYGCLIVVALKETFGLPPLLLLVVNQKFGLICAMILQYTSDMSPPIGLGMIPLLATLQSPAATTATLFLVHDLYIIPNKF